MDSYTTIWNNFCKSVTKAQSNNQKEMAFEKSTMIDLLSGLGWSQLRNNLDEQRRMTVGHTEVFADFVLHEVNSPKGQVVIELKRPKHNQTKEDIDQLCSYMKLSFSPFGLYIGEKIEIYYNRLGDQNEPVSINSINYTIDNKEGIYLLHLLKFDTFDSDKWKNYCEDSIKLMQSVEYWTSEKGKEELFQFILDKAKLSPNFTERLRTLLKISVEKNLFKTASEAVTDEPQQGFAEEERPGQNPKPHKKGKREVYNFNGKTYNAKDYAMAIVKKLMSDHPSFTYLQIKSTFPKSFAWGPVFLTTNEWKAKKKSVRENYFGNDILTDANGQKFVFSNQWTHDGVVKMRECLDKVSSNEVPQEISHKEDKQEEIIAQANNYIQAEPSFNMPRKGQTVYSLNGSDFFPAAAIGYNVVKKYIKEYPNATIEEIKKIMPLKVFGFWTIINESVWKSRYSSGNQKRRYVQFPFFDGQGKKFFVSNQWDKASVKELEPLISKLGWKIEKVVKA